MNDFSRFGFKITETRELGEICATYYRMTHEKTGLELVWLKRDEENKTFGIAFETLPFDDTGVFHILEHSVLCGSDRYPVKEPFVELMKSSMNTFLNALTFSDKTFYPVSSRNGKDFINLMRVYLDAVFCPLIYSKPEIFRQEGWHYETDGDGKVSYKGVVFNEMKGAFTSPDELVYCGLLRILFPDSPYGFVSGGDPEAIPDLTYESFTDTHRRFYSPSNGYVFLDGDVDIEKVLSILDGEYLSKYERTERMAPPALQTPVFGSGEGFYEISDGEDTEGKVRLALGRVIGTFDEREKTVAMHVLSSVLTGSNQAPLCKALLSEGLCEEISIDINDGVLQPFAVIDVRNLREEDAERVESVIIETLRELCEKGLDRAQLEAVMANTEFRMRERDYGSEPKGLAFGFTALESWLYGGDPAAFLEVGDLFVRLREKMDEGYFESLIKEVLLDCPHSARLLLRPSHTEGAERRGREQARLDREVSSWSAEKRAEIEEAEEKLALWQESVDSPEMLLTIPKLSIEDIPSKPEMIPTDVREISGIPVIVHDLNCSGILYVSLYFDIDFLTEEDLSYLSFASALLGECDTKRHSAEELINSTRLLCGYFATYPAAFTVGGDPLNVRRKLCVTFSTMKRDLEAAFAHVAEILTESVPDGATARDILRQTKTDIFERAIMSGNSVGLSRIMAQYSVAGVVDDCVGGIGYYKWLKDADENWDFDAINGRIGRILSDAVNRNSVILSVSGADGSEISALADGVSRLIPEREKKPSARILTREKTKEGIIVPSDISFAVMGANIRPYGGAHSGQLQLASQIISLAYLWNVIRVRGGAYGTGMKCLADGYVGCSSYRDPSGADSLERYTEAPDALREIAKSGEDLTDFIIGAVASASPLLTSRQKATVGDSRYLSEVSYETLCKKRKELLGATPKDLEKVADLLDKAFSDASVCIVGGREQIERCPDLDSVITL